MPGSDLDPTPSARSRSTSAWPSPPPRKRLAKVWILESLTPLPHMDSRSPAFTALRKNNTSHAMLLFLTLLLGKPHAAIRITSLTSREISFDSGFCFLGGPRHGSPQ